MAGRNPTRTVRYLLILAICLLVFSISWFKDWNAPSIHLVGVDSNILDLGTIEPGKSAMCFFQILNRGGKPLTVYKAITSCGCLGVQKAMPEGLRPIGTEVIEPGKHLSLRVTLGMKSVQQNIANESVVMETNDPKNHWVIVKLIAHAPGRIIEMPTELELGSMRPGEEITRQIEVWDTGTTQRVALTKVSSGPDIIITSNNIKSASDESYYRGLGRLLYNIDLSLRLPVREGHYHDTITLTNESRHFSLTVPVRTHVLPNNELIPSAVILPRISGDQLAFKIECICRNTWGKTISVVSREAPVGLSVSVNRGLDPCTASIAIEWKARDSEPGTLPRGDTITLLVQTSDSSETVKLPIMLWTDRLKR